MGVIYFFKSLATRSFWRYAVFSQAGAARVFMAVGVIWTFIEALDFFGIYERSQYGKFAFLLIILAGVIFAALRVRPVSRVSYKVPGKDLCVDVRIGDLLKAEGAVVVSTNTTFDTDLASGLISASSLQGQFVQRFFAGQTQALDNQIDTALHQYNSQPSQHAFTKALEFPLGTVARVDSHGNTYYLLAMSKFNEQKNAFSTLSMIDEALEGLWDFVGHQGDLRDLNLPLLGTGRGRLIIPRKKIIERIVQSFVDASKTAIIANKLIIYVHPGDAENFEMNLFEIRDYLVQSVHY